MWGAVVGGGWGRAAGGRAAAGPSGPSRCRFWPHLDHHVLHEVVLKALELQLQHGREAVKQDALARVLRGRVGGQGAAGGVSGSRVSGSVPGSSACARQPTQASRPSASHGLPPACSRTHTRSRPTKPPLPACLSLTCMPCCSALYWLSPASTSTSQNLSNDAYTSAQSLTSSCGVARARSRGGGWGGGGGECARVARLHAGTPRLTARARASPARASPHRQPLPAHRPLPPLVSLSHPWPGRTCMSMNDSRRLDL